MNVNKTVSIFVAAMIVASLAIPTIVRAQSTLLSVTVPFDFYFADQKFEAGDYTIGRMGEVIRVSNQTGRTAVSLSNAAFVRPQDVQKARVVFNRYGITYFLSQVQWSDYGSARELPPSSVELRIAKNLPAIRVVATSTRR
jgi:hypothetical protein